MVSNKSKAVELERIDVQRCGDEDYEWLGPELPEPYDLTAVEHSDNACQAGIECANRIVTFHHGDEIRYGGYLIGFHLLQDEYGIERVSWLAGFLVDGLVLCEDCTFAYEEGELTYSQEDGFQWK